MQAKPGSGSSISSCPPATRAQFEDLAVLVPGEVFLKAVTPRGAGVRIVGRVTSNRSLADSMRALLKSKDFRDPVLVSLGAVEGEGHLREFVIALSSRCPARQP
jgi:Tfp pilus assembly protein PilN